MIMYDTWVGRQLVVGGCGCACVGSGWLGGLGMQVYSGRVHR